MPATITIEEAQAKRKELLHQLAPGEEVVITENPQPVAKLVNQPPKPGRRPPPGLGAGREVQLSPALLGDGEDRLRLLGLARPVGEGSR